MSTRSSYRDREGVLEYWFVVKPTHEELYQGLRTVLQGRPGIHIIKERRSVTGVGPFGERRLAHVWHGDYLDIAECRTAP